LFKMKIKSMQVRVEQILELLKTVKSYTDVDRNWKLVKDSTGWSDRTFYHVAPACQYLHLIEKRSGMWIRTTYYGEQLVCSSEEGKGGEVLGKILVEWDEKEYRIVEAFLNLYNRFDVFPGEPLELRDLRNELESLGVYVHLSVLRDFLGNIYSYCQLAGVISERALLNIRRVEELKHLKLFPTAEDVSDATFFKYLYESYLLTLPKMRGIKSVPIPEVRKLVCRRSMLNIPPDVFDQKLISLHSNFEGKRISLTPPMERKTGGIFLGKTYYYYIAIYE